MCIFKFDKFWIVQSVSQRLEPNFVVEWSEAMKGE